MKNSPSLDFEQLYTEFGGQLYRFCFRLTGDRSEAEDLTQDVFVAALYGRERFRGQSTPRTWLYRIALYQAGKRRIKRKRETQLYEEALAPVHQQEPRADLDRAIDQLPPNIREAFLLVKVEGFTTLEAAEILQLPEGTVKFHVYEAIRRLRTALQDLPSESSKESSHAV